MTDEKAVVTQVESVDLATVKGIVLPGRDVTPMTRFHKLNIQHVQFRAERGLYRDWEKDAMHADDSEKIFDDDDMWKVYEANA